MITKGQDCAALFIDLSKAFTVKTQFLKENYQSVLVLNLLN